MLHSAAPHRTTSDSRDDVVQLHRSIARVMNMLGSIYRACVEVKSHILEEMPDVRIESSVGKPEGKACRKRIHFDRCRATNTRHYCMDCRMSRCAGRWATSGKMRADANTEEPIGKGSWPR
ncbi:hypothetical protein L1887_61010 [Cichorium endivia]|nr:hypothetical protein L1887_61010 [Cichorium endivia]